MAHQAQMDGTLRQKLALFAGFQLYLTFVNLFLSLLRLLGNQEFENSIFETEKQPYVR